MTYTIIENIKRYINDKIDIAQMIVEADDDKHTIEYEQEVHDGILVAEIEYSINRDYYTEFSTDNLTPPEHILRDWSFKLESQYWGWVDEDGEEHDITSNVELNKDELNKSIDNYLSY